MRYILSILFVLFVVAVSVYAQQPDVVEYTVTSTRAPLRDRPGVSTEIVEIVANGDTLYIYDEEQEHAGWLRVWREGKDDVWIVDTLVKKASQGFYPLSQEPLFSASGRGADITEIFEIPLGAYRIDAVVNVNDSYFILQSIVLDGNCRDQFLFYDDYSGGSNMNISTIFISQGCSIIFQTERVHGDWQIKLRDLLDAEALETSILEIKNETSIAGIGHQLTMATQLPSGFWSINATVQHRTFTLRAHILSGECDDTEVFREYDFDANSLEIETVYRNPGSEPCMIFWETDDIYSDWELTFEKLR